MWLQLTNVMYVLVAISMVVLILMQRGAGAQAGSGFGGGASSTVFGSRGASNFLTKSTKWLGVLFFTISMGMAMYASKSAVGAPDTKADLGVMGQPEPFRIQEMPKVPTAPAQPAQTVPAPAIPVAAPQYTQPDATQAQPQPATQPPAASPAAPAQGG